MTSGGTLSETLLWSNSSPSSNFAGQTITLSQDYANFEYLKVNYTVNKGGTVYSILYDINLVKDADGTANHPYITISGFNGASALGRRGQVVATNQIKWQGAAGIGGTTTSTSYLIPTAIYGLK